MIKQRQTQVSSTRSGTMNSSNSNIQMTSSSTVPVATLKSAWILAFVIISAIHLTLNFIPGDGADLAASITKCFIAPMLIGWVWQYRGPRTIMIALVFCTFGDFFLELPQSFFIAGMGAFGVGHICFMITYLPRGARATLKAKPWIVVPYLILAAGLLAWAWPGLPDFLKVGAPLYAILLIGTGICSVGLDLMTGLGGFIFMASDGLILLTHADRIGYGGQVAIMPTYITSLVLLIYQVVVNEPAWRLKTSTPKGAQANVATASHYVPLDRS